MEIWNHFTFRKDMHPLTTDYILSHKIKCDYDEILSAVDISENDPHWEEISRLLRLDHNTYLSETRFSKSELLGADWLTVRSQWHYDYPQPEDRYTEITYSEEDFCSNCGIGLVQKDCFRFKRTPKWGKRNFCTTNWVYDELFASPEHFNSTMKVTFITCGTDDPRHAYTQPQVQELIDKGYNLEYSYYPGYHEWDVWRYSARDYMMRLFK